MSCCVKTPAEEVLAHISAVFGFKGLVIAVNGFFHQLNQLTAGVLTVRSPVTAKSLTNWKASSRALAGTLSRLSGAVIS
jgi:hypothetical protein